MVGTFDLIVVGARPASGGSSVAEVKLAVGLDFWQSFQLFLGVAGQQNSVITALEPVVRHGDILATHAKKATSANQ